MWFSLNLNKLQHTHRKFRFWSVTELDNDECERDEKKRIYWTKYTLRLHHGSHLWNICETWPKFQSLFIQRMQYVNVCSDFALKSTLYSFDKSSLHQLWTSANASLVIRIKMQRCETRVLKSISNSIDWLNSHWVPANVYGLHHSLHPPLPIDGSSPVVVSICVYAVSWIVVMLPQPFSSLSERWLYAMEIVYQMVCDSGRQCIKQVLDW